MRLPWFVVTLLLLGVVAAIGFLDWLTGPDLGFSLFYLAPIVYAGWRLGRVPVVLVAVGASVAWTVAELAWNPASDLTTAWNAFTRLAIYVTIGLLTAVVRADRDELRRAIDRETALARTDAVTGLPNSRSMMELLQQETLRRRAESRPIAMAYLDLDNFKAVNDARGHAAGDALLQEVAAILRQSVDPGDIPARVGGDEFAVLASISTTADSMRATAARIEERVRRLGERYPGLGFGASVGTAWFPVPPEQPDELFRAADAAMYDVKVAHKLREGDRRRRVT